MMKTNTMLARCLLVIPLCLWCIPCATLNTRQAFPHEYSGLTSTDASARVRSVLLPSERASGAHSFGNIIVTPEQRKNIVVTPEGIQVQGYEKDYRTTASPQGGGVTAYRTYKFRGALGPTVFQWGDLKTVRVRRAWSPGSIFANPDYVEGGRLRGDYNIYMRWEWSESLSTPPPIIMVEATQEDLKAFILSISKLAPNATIQCRTKYLE